MLRSAAKNHKFVTVISDVNDYNKLIIELDNYEGCTSYEFRKELAARTFALTAYYDTLVSDWFLDNNIHIFLGFNYCDTEKKEKIMNGNMRNVLECKNKEYLHVYKSRNGPTGSYPLDTFTKQ